MKRNMFLLEVIQVSTDKVHGIKFFGAVNGDVLPDFAAISSIYSDTSMNIMKIKSFLLKKSYIDRTEA